MANNGASSSTLPADDLTALRERLSQLARELRLVDLRRGIKAAKEDIKTEKTLLEEINQWLERGMGLHAKIHRGVVVQQRVEGVDQNVELQLDGGDENVGAKLRKKEQSDAESDDDGQGGVNDFDDDDDGGAVTEDSTGSDDDDGGDGMDYNYDDAKLGCILPHS
ncbi:uncharacterized protein LOC110711552 [Chenopodium quinoa]|uniref:uncharacterized protein LOC110711552 n=1 Tax=Chenopodium quinoa TaxID=63459 RepID=UPI000B77522D|nr:uncharacterized protein LOC110711552 [Chenopodium quinoa]